MANVESDSDTVNKVTPRGTKFTCTNVRGNRICFVSLCVTYACNIFNYCHTKDLRNAEQLF